MGNHPVYDSINPQPDWKAALQRILSSRDGQASSLDELHRTMQLRNPAVAGHKACEGQAKSNDLCVVPIWI